MLFSAPQQHDLQRFRLQWLPFGADVVATALEEEGWVLAWHGTKLEALYSQIMFGRLFASSAWGAGERFFSGAPGVYLHQDKTAHKAEDYSWYVQFVQCLIFCW